MKALARSWSGWRSVAGLAWDIAVRAPGPAVTVLLIQLCNGARNGLYVWLTAGVINGLVNGHGAVAWTTGFAAVLMGENLTWTFMLPARNWLRDVATLRTQERVLDLAARAPLLRFSDPQWVDRLSRASGNLSDRMGGWLAGVFDLVGAVVQVGGMLLAVFALGGRVALIAALLGASVVGVICQGRLSGVELARSQRLARPRRVAAAWSGLLTARAAAPEVRVFDIGEWLRSRWEAAYRLTAGEDLRTALRRFGWEGLNSAADLGAYALVLVLAAVAALHTGPARAPGVFAALLEASIGMQGFFGNLLGTAGGMHQHTSFVADLASLLWEEHPAEGAAPEGEGGGTPRSPRRARIWPSRTWARGSGPSSAGATCRAGSGYGWRWRAPSLVRPPSSCWTNRRLPSILWKRWRSSGACWRSGGGGRRSSSRTAWGSRGRRTASWCSTEGAWWRRDATTRWWPARDCTRGCGRHRPRGTRLSRPLRPAPTEGGRAGIGQAPTGRRLASRTAGPAKP